MWQFIWEMPVFIAELFSTRILFFSTGQIIFVLLGSYGIWKIKERKESTQGFDK